MAAVGEEEEDDAMGEELPPTRYDTAVRERELATQKIRIVSEMAASKQREEVQVRRPSPRKQPLGPATTVPSTRSAAAHSEHKSTGKGKAVDMAAKPETPGLFETVGVLLADAFAASDTDEGYRAPGE